MTQEEKAKAYDEALEKIREGLQPLPDGAKISGVTRAFLEEVFPELKESEDERIRKDLLAFIKAPYVYDFIVHDRVDPWIAWLEKQGEPKQEWSKEDENRFQNIIACIEDCYKEKDAQDLIRWFKSLIHQPKQVWSKADIKMLELIIDGYQNTEDFSKVDGVFVDWLKSLKDRMKGKED